MLKISIPTDIQILLIKALLKSGTHECGGVLMGEHIGTCLLYTSPSPRDGLLSRMPSSA